MFMYRKILHHEKSSLIYLQYLFQRAYNERGVVFLFIRQVLALPFLPPEHVEETFHHLDRKANNDQLDSLLEYVWRQWIRNPTFPVKNWSVFMLSVRTNNALKGGTTGSIAELIARVKFRSTFSLWNFTVKQTTFPWLPDYCQKERWRGSTGRGTAS